ncbi:peptidase family T4 protein [Neohortaea acidophila]|uniref:Peptidase family T4 protein n=1 Tax=Neohortaea acidophila TaxID=245834 RepID=A0A6A6Q1U8_9PEZI|nr:peptidase family T4 protein [Neohortaea acidophila]KAF2485959.1 peptidase family T4 protein [Neohortaea acidophila]
MPSSSIRDVLPNLQIGVWPPGPKNSITDVEGVLVHTQSIHAPASDTHDAVNTGVTTILPRKHWYRDCCYAGICRFNGAGELTGSHWIAETGLLNSPIIITGTFGIGAAHQGVYEYLCRDQPEFKEAPTLPVVGETWDGQLSDVGSFAVTPDHIVTGIRNATSDAVSLGNTGGGTGMVCHQYKGGTGSSSRIIAGHDIQDQTKRSYTVGVLVQANYGKKRNLRIGGVPIGRLLMEQDEKAAAAATYQEPNTARKDGSIIIIIATDAPLHPLQLQRLATRATVGLSRVGGLGHNGSGDIFLAFSTANKDALQNAGNWIGGGKDPAFEPKLLQLQALDENTINELMEGAADATEEAIYNALCAAETMTKAGHTIEALPLDRVKRIMEKYLI